jgi:hypothetical protein
VVLLVQRPCLRLPPSQVSCPHLVVLLLLALHHNPPSAALARRLHHQLLVPLLQRPLSAVLHPRRLLVSPQRLSLCRCMPLALALHPHLHQPPAAWSHSLARPPPSCHRLLSLQPVPL